MKREKLKMVFILFLILPGLGLFSQEVKTEEFKPSGKANGKVFWNFNYNLTDDVDQRASFAVQRVYFGYNYNISEKFTAVILLDGAKQTVTKKGAISSEYTVFVKNAFLSYKMSKAVVLTGGMIETQQMNTQDKFWGYRYLFKPFQDEFGLGTTADLGVNGEVSLAKNLKVNLFVLNGDGFTKVQDELGMMKIGTSILYEPIEGLLLKGYYDIYGGKAAVNDSVINTDTCYSHIYDFWAGYKTDKFRIGAGYTSLLNGTNYYTVAENYNLSGLYASGAFALNKQFEVFGMWFNSKSSTLPGKTDSWNYEKDGNILLAGIQYAPIKGVKMALNYRTVLFDSELETDQSMVFMNFEFSF